MATYCFNGTSYYLGGQLNAEGWAAYDPVID